MKRLRKGLGFYVLFAALASTASVTGCSSGADQSSENDAGKVSMQLTGQTNGVEYRLRNARFDVTGPTNTVLDSEADLTLVTLNATLSTGSYAINLEPGWSLERGTAGTFEVVDATLTSANPKAFQILGGGTTNVAFQFSTSGTVVTIGTGELDVSIQVVENGGGGGGTCGLAAQTGCAAPQACYFVTSTDGTSGSGQCLSPGTVAIGAPCTGIANNECVAGGVCGGDSSGNTQCLKMCDPTTSPSTCTNGQSCADTGIPNLGVCI